MTGYCLLRPVWNFTWHIYSSGVGRSYPIPQLLPEIQCKYCWLCVLCCFVVFVFAPHICISPSFSNSALKWPSYIFFKRTSSFFLSCDPEPTFHHRTEFEGIEMWFLVAQKRVNKRKIYKDMNAECMNAINMNANEFYHDMLYSLSLTQTMTDYITCHIMICYIVCYWLSWYVI